VEVSLFLERYLSGVIGLRELAIFSCFSAESLVTGRLSAVEGLHDGTCFGATSLAMGCLSAVEALQGGGTMACFAATSLITGRLSAVVARCRVTTSARTRVPSLDTGHCLSADGRYEVAVPTCFIAMFLVVGCLLPVKGLCGLLMLDCFGADLVAGRLSEVDGRCGVAMLDSFGAETLVITRL
jgi:hypothetical protein